MIVNPEKHQAMVLGTTDHKFSFPVEDSLDLLGMTIDNQFNFNNKMLGFFRRTISGNKILSPQPATTGLPQRSKGPFNFL